MIFLKNKSFKIDKPSLYLLIKYSSCLIGFNNETKLTPKWNLLKKNFTLKSIFFFQLPIF